MFSNAITNTKSRFATVLDAARNNPTQDPAITPYVGKRGHLSQAWLNRWTVLLLLVLARLILATIDLNDGLGSAEREALSACTGVESAASAMASMPHYMSQGTNELVASGVERAIDGLMSMLMLTVTGVEEIVVFVINMLTSTYLCLITLAVRGSLHVAIGLIEDVTNFLNSTLGNIGNDINNSINDFEGQLNKVIDGLNDVGSIFGGDKTIPTLDVNDSISALENLHLPDTINESLDKLNSSIPTFDEVRNLTDNAIRFPFEELKKFINDSLPHYTVDRNLFPVPDKEKMTFCSGNNGITDFFADLIHIKDMARTIGIAVLVALAIAVIGPMAWREARRYKMQQQRAQLIGSQATDNMDVIYIASRPYTASAGLMAAAPVSSDRRRALVRWVVAYATTPAALFVLSLGLAGLFSALCQYALLRSIQKEVPALSHQVGEFAGQVVGSLNNASAKWANGTNSVILDTNKQINDDVFGWVNKSTSAVNDTLNVFIEQTTNALNQTFGGTILYDPITEVFNCLIGLKIESFQKGLTWVSDHAHIDFPLLANDTFSLGAAASLSNSTADDSFLADPNSGASDKITAAVDHLINRMARQIRDEAIISGVVLAVWVLVALIGVGRALTLWWGHGGTATDSARGPEGPKGRFDFDSSSVTQQDFASNEKLAPVAYRAPAPAPVPVPPPPAPPAAPASTTTSTRDFANVPLQYQQPHGNGSASNTYNGVPYTLDRRPMPRFGSSLAPENGNEQERRGNVGVRSVTQALSASNSNHQVQRKSVHPPVLNAGMARSPAVGMAAPKVTFASMGH